MTDLKKTYYGYKPKSKDVVKLEAYVRNNSNTNVLSNELPKSTNSITNKILKNKRIK